jgi:hypothetical protein
MYRYIKSAVETLPSKSKKILITILIRKIPIISSSVEDAGQLQYCQKVRRNIQTFDQEIFTL